MIYIHNLDPVALDLGFAQIYWYGLSYAAGFLFSYLLLRRAAMRPRALLSLEQVDSLVFACALGVVLGGRIGHFLFYAWSQFLADPLELLRVWHGGMSFHGGLLGVMLALLWLGRTWRKSWLDLLDLVTLPAALGLFFGRLANFVNGELWGVPTGADWGVVFPRSGDGLPRHPSQLYEAAKNLILFAVLALITRSSWPRGLPTFLFLSMYGTGRIIIEQFWRAPVDGMIGSFTAGQFWSLPLLASGLIGLGWIYRSHGMNSN